MRAILVTCMFTLATPALAGDYDIWERREEETRQMELETRLFELEQKQIQQQWELERMRRARDLERLRERERETDPVWYSAPTYGLGSPWQ